MKTVFQRSIEFKIYLNNKSYEILAKGQYLYKI